jgi:starch phosphorylase
MADGGPKVGKTLRVEAAVNLGQLQARDVCVELYSGPLDDEGQLSLGQPTRMEQIAADGEHRVRYAVQMPCLHSGLTGYTVRVLPCREHLGDGKDMGLIRWA